MAARLASGGRLARIPCPFGRLIAAWMRGTEMFEKRAKPTEIEASPADFSQINGTRPLNGEQPPDRPKCEFCLPYFLEDAILWTNLPNNYLPIEDRQ